MTVAVPEIARWVQALAPARQLAEIIASTEFVPAAMRGKPDVVTACIMYGDEIGIGPMQALAGIHMVDGQPRPSAELTRAMILREGHTITVHTLSTEVARISGLRRGEPEDARVYVEWNVGDARRAGLLGKRNWQQYPRHMLLARATGDLARIKFPDVIKGLSVVDEDAPEGLDTWVAVSATENGAQAPETQRVKTRRRRELAPRTDQPVPDIADTLLPESVPDSAPEPRPPVAPGPSVDTPESDTSGQGQIPTPVMAPQVPRPRAPEPDEPEPEPEMIQPNQRAYLMAALSRIGIDPSRDREMRQALLGALVGRDLGSSSDLTRSEALLAIRLLNDIETGALAWEYETATGHVSLDWKES